MNKDSISNIENLFVLPNEALELKQLGFDECCFSIYKIELDGKYYLFNINPEDIGSNNSDNPDNPNICTAPTYQQAFNFFRTTYGLSSSITSSMRNDIQVNYFTVHELKNRLMKSNFFNYKISPMYNTYEKSELACLKFLIHKVTNQIKELNKNKTNG